MCISLNRGGGGALGVQRDSLLSLTLNSIYTGIVLLKHFFCSLDVVRDVLVADERHLDLLERPDDGVRPHLDLRRDALPQPLPQRTLRREQEVDGVPRHPDHGGAEWAEVHQLEHGSK